ncbi:MAG: TerB family tellurite resistance protein [Agarilytica sp.]
MLSRIKAFFDTDLNHGQDLSQDQLNLACAALLIEVAVIDQEFDAKEFAALVEILHKQYGIAAHECDALVKMAQQECADATSLYQFTQRVNQYCSAEDKFALIKGMWSIAFADGDLDKYEEYIIRKTSDLLHVGHGDFIRAKHDAKATLL